MGLVLSPRSGASGMVGILISHLSGIENSLLTGRCHPCYTAVTNTHSGWASVASRTWLDERRTAFAGLPLMRGRRMAATAALACAIAFCLVPLAATRAEPARIVHGGDASGIPASERLATATMLVDRGDFAAARRHIDQALTEATTAASATRWPGSPSACAGSCSTSR